MPEFETDFDGTHMGRENNSLEIAPYQFATAQRKRKRTRVISRQRPTYFSVWLRRYNTYI